MIQAINKCTKSYDTPMTKEEMKSLVGKVLIKFQKYGGRSINDMTNWLRTNNFGSYQDNMWIRAMVDAMFKRNLGTWFPINQNLSVDQLTDKIMGYWNNKLKK